MKSRPTRHFSILSSAGVPTGPFEGSERHVKSSRLRRWLRVPGQFGEALNELRTYGVTKSKSHKTQVHFSFNDMLFKSLHDLFIQGIRVVPY